MPPITGFLLDSRDQGGDATFFDTNVYSPSANRTIILIASGIGSVPPPVPIIPLVTGNGLTWATVAVQRFDWAGVDRGIISVHRGLGASPTSGVTRVQYARTFFRQALVVLEFANTDIGNLGANAVVGSPVTAKAAGGAGLNPSVTMPTAEDQANATLGVIGGQDPNPVVVQGLGFIILKTLFNSEGGFQSSEFSQVPLAVADWNLSDDNGLAVIGVELRNATPTGAEAGPQVQGRPSFLSGNLIT